LRTEARRRKSASPTRKTTQKVIQIQGWLMSRPNAPSEPRAIRQATCGPVHASVTSPVASSTFALTISPASGRSDQMLTVQEPASSSSVACFVSPFAG
jgi:hypothetical protein